MTPTNKALEAAAENYAVKNEQATLNIERIKRAVLFGAAWQKEQDAERMRVLDAKIISLESALIKTPEELHKISDTVAKWGFGDRAKGEEK